MPRLRKVVEVDEPVIETVAKRAYARQSPKAVEVEDPVVVHDSTGSTPRALRAVHPLVVSRALQLAGGDVRRLEVVDSRTVTVH